MTGHDKPAEELARTKITPELAEKLQTLQEGERLRVIIRLKEKPKIMQAAVPVSTIQRLKETARRTQRPVLQYLGTGIRAEAARKMHPFWLINLVFAEVNRAEAEDLAALPGVSALYEDYRVMVNAERVAGRIEQTWDNIGFVKAPEVWAQGYRGQGVTVAVVDTGIDISHPELQGALGGAAPYHEGYWAEFDENGELVEFSKPHDTDEHGTHVSGTAGGRNRRTRIGMAPEVTLAHGLILPGGSGTLPQVLAGLQWVAEQGFDIINGSFGIDKKSEDLFQAVENLVQLGVFPVFAVGNSGPGISSAPGNTPLAEAVGAFDAAGEIADFSGGGVVEYQDYLYIDEMEKIKPEIAAPGVDIFSAVPGGGYVAFNGTSMAAPHLAGAAALLLSKNPAMNVQQLKELLHRSVGGYVGLLNDPGEPGKDVRYGWGRLNVLQAINAAPDQREVCYVQGYILGDEELVQGAELTFSGPEVKQFTTNEYGFYQGTILAGDYQVRVRARAYRPETREITAVFGKKVLLNFHLDPAPPGWIVGEVIDEVTGQWLPDVQVDIPGSSYATKTNTEGVYKLEVKEGKYNLRFANQGFYPLVVEEVEVIPDEMVEVSTTLRFGKDNLQGLVVEEKTAKPISGCCITEKTTEAITFSDENGQFMLSLPAGSYDVQIEGVGYLPLNGQVAVQHGVCGIANFTLIPRQVDVLLANHFSSTEELEQWELSGGWHLSQRRTASAPYSLWHGDEKSGKYPNNQQALCKCKEIQLPHEGKTELNFRFWSELERDYDRFKVKLTTEEGADTDLFEYSKPAGTWQNVSLDLSQFNGQKIQLSFMVDSDFSIMYEGVYLDDLLVYRVLEE